MITDPNDPEEVQGIDRQFWRWGELRAKYRELARRRRQALKDGLLLTGLLCLHIALMLTYHHWFLAAIRSLGPCWLGVSLGQWVLVCGARRWITRQSWWEVR